ncbi:hypothetical protein RJ639_028479 [Escallonia herrerae]|uniref:PPM-type phosphatase domain-containing protein n=1 Tax=Escallonia herrerae TaxID=1293975 RepID=A0AA89BEZ3_9ASTE|nr:hypothetical protein RJ639_028479 [Escallonia herrerae]
MTQVKCRSILELALHIFFFCAYFAIARYGVIAEPEVLDWRAIKGNDVFLVVASDGIFESLSMKSVCGLLEENSPKCSSSSSLADCITEVALRRGSTDNLSAIYGLVMLLCLNSDAIPNSTLPIGGAPMALGVLDFDLDLMATLGCILHQGCCRARPLPNSGGSSMVFPWSPTIRRIADGDSICPTASCNLTGD